MQITLGRAPGPPPNRSTDRLVALASIAVAAAFLAAALATFLLPVTARRGLWLPLHLALAGAATSAIAGVLPFFVAAFAAAQPAAAPVRIAGSPDDLANGRVSVDSPVGRAIYRCGGGDEIRIDAPDGTWTATVISVE